MKNELIKTIDLHAKEWFDKVNGNSYFSAQITLNFGEDTQRIINIPFQYGYGSHFEQSALHQLQCENLIPTNLISNLWYYCENHNIPYRKYKKTKCLKSEVKNFVKY